MPFQKRQVLILEKLSNLEKYSAGRKFGRFIFYFF